MVVGIFAVNLRSFHVLILAGSFLLLTSLSLYYLKIGPESLSLPLPFSRYYGQAHLEYQSYSNGLGVDWEPGAPQPLQHPIDKLTREARGVFESLTENEARGVNEAATTYRERRGRHPPPGFDAWIKYAEEHDALIFEKFFDQIYQDVQPFWSLPAEDIRSAAASWPNLVSVRNGKVIKRDYDSQNWLGLWKEMLDEAKESLPDVDIPFNTMDETRVLIPFEQLANYTDATTASAGIDTELLSAPGSGSEYEKYPSIPEEDQVGNRPASRLSYTYHEGDIWSAFHTTCPPDAPARDVEFGKDFSDPPTLPHGWPMGSFQGYVGNVSIARDPCQHPDLRYLHGSFIEPMYKNITTTLFPVFSGSKLPTSNEILVPPPMYWARDDLYSKGEEILPGWDDKIAKAIWRGSASGGRSRSTTWDHFHRHRFVAMSNGTWISILQKELASSGSEPLTLPMPFVNPSTINANYDIRALNDDGIESWMREHSDAAFTHLGCFPQVNESCPYTDHFYKIGSPIPMHDQFKFKFLPDVDANSFSGRYRSFLRSNSLPIKATIYREWHDARLVPWLHYVPMDNTFVDYLAILEYFFGFEHQVEEEDGSPMTEVLKDSHDDVARELAEEGAAWAARVLRKEDMVLYLWRVVLEYARVASDNRDHLGYVDDLLGEVHP